MAMLPEYYPGLPEDPYMEYLQKLGQFQRSSSGIGQNPSYPASSYSPNALDYLDQLDQARLQQAMMPNLPKTLGSDPASMIERQFKQYRDREPVAPPTRSQSVRPPSPAVQSRQMAGPPQQAQGPANPPRDTSPFNYNIPAAPKTPAVQTAGLLDTEDAPESGNSWYDDPTRMGLLQAGLGLMSAPR